MQNYQNALDDTAITSANADIAQHSIDAHQAADDALLKADPSDKNFVNDFLEKNWDDSADAIKSKYSDASPKVQKAVADELSAQRGQLGDRLVGEQSGLARQQATDNEAVRVNTIGKQAITDPASLPTLLDQNERQIGMFSSIPEATKASHIADTNAQIAGRAATSLVNQLEANPNASPAMADHLKQQFTDPNGPFFKNMKDETLQSLLGKLDKEKDSQASLQGKITEINFPDVVKRVLQNGDDGTAQKMVDGMPERTPEEAATKYRMNKELSEATAGHSQIDIVSMPEADAQNRLAQLQGEVDKAPPDQLGAAQTKLAAATNMLAQRDKAFQSAPAEYMIDNNGKVNAAYQNFKKNQTPQAFAVYAATSAGEQERMYPGITASVITDEIRGEAKSVVQSIGVDTAGPVNASKSLYQMSQKYGSFWPGIASDLRSEHILSNEQYVAASMVANPRSQGVAEAILTASSMGGDARFKLYGIAETKAQKIAISALAPLNGSLANVPPSQRAQLMVGYTDALTHVMQAGGKADADIASNLAGKMILGEYQFAGAQRTIRVPANADAGAITAGSDSVLNDIGNHNIVVPTGSLGPTAQRANYVKQLQLTGRWYTNAKGDGAVLYDENMHTVMETLKGRTQPVTLNWTDLSSLGQTKGATQGQIEDNEQKAIR